MLTDNDGGRMLAMAQNDKKITVHCRKIIKPIINNDVKNVFTYYYHNSTGTKLTRGRKVHKKE
jgi:hypothetical protein